jgi:GAF domain-containing protein
MASPVKSLPEVGFRIGEMDTFPFRRQLSLAPLISFWETALAAHSQIGAGLGAIIKDWLRQAPELGRPIEDLGVIAPHRELVETLMSKVIPSAYREQDYAGAFLPFTLKPFYVTPPFEQLFVRDGVLHGRINLDDRTMDTGRLLRAYGLILQKFYGISMTLDYPIILSTVDPGSGLERHFSMQLDYRFVDVRVGGTPPALSEDDRRRLLANLGDTEMLATLLPPDRFAFEGFAVLRATDVTDQEVLSSLKRDLIERESIVSTERFHSLQQKLCTYLRCPDLRLSLAAIQGERVFMLNSGRHLEHSCLFADSVHHTISDFAGSIFDRASRQREPMVIEDLAGCSERTAVEDAILEGGTRSLIVAPLHYQGQLLGMLKLASPNPGELKPMATLKLREVLPLFTMALRRSIEELEQRVQSLIKEQCTAIHPSVEWRFRQAAFQAMERRASGAAAEMEPIVFKNVYPLYAVSDIRGSSEERNRAIQADLVTHLRLAREVIERAHEARPLPVLDQLRYRIDRHIGQLEDGLSSGDETRIIDFLREHVEPRLDHLASFGAAVRERFSAYRAAMDPRLGTIYRRRKQYEESVTRINDTIGSYLDAEQEMAQAMFPHYFEKQQTDGIDYSMYVGAALVEDGLFDELYLKNLRLWQLMVTCGIARRVEALRGRLAVPLETAHLILVQHTPLSIRFRYDEKRFDVDGAYNVRYEVIKKRIDKAKVRGASERVTQPGKMAIVYSHRNEAIEYRQYLEYLRNLGYVTGEPEELELEEMQGVQGLRALRATIDLSGVEPEPRSAVRQAVAGVGALAR